METTLNGLPVMVQILFNPFIGPAGFNMVAVGVYLALAMLCLCAYMERGRND